MSPPKRRSGPGASAQAASTSTATVTSQCNRSTDVELDLALVGDNADLWARLFDGEFRLAVRCDVCGRWLTAGKSKSAGRGPSCAARAVE